MSYSNTDEALAQRVNDSPCGGMSCEKGTFKRSDPDKAWCDSGPWDDWAPQWFTDGGCINGTRDDMGEPPTDCAQPANRCGQSGAGGPSFVTWAAPINLAFFGYVADYQLFLARMALDVGIQKFWENLWDGDISEALDYFTDAQRLARYALGLMLEHANTVIHEMGHAYLGGGHCEHNCCFEVIAEHWECKVRGLLGLAHQTYTTRGSSDWQADEAFFHQTAKCGKGEQAGHLIYSCDVHEVGSIGEAAAFCSTGCLPDWIMDSLESIGADQLVCGEEA